MKTKLSPAVVGGFVLGALLLGLVALLSFGSLNFMSKSQRFVVYFNESIQGLDLGSPVKLSGVRVGRVVDLHVCYDPRDNHRVVAVVCELSKKMIRDNQGAVIDAADPRELQTLVDRGLRAQLGVIGLATGLLFVELDFLDPHTFPPDLPPITGTGYPAVPAVPSAISEFQASSSRILSKLEQVDFVALGNDLDGVLVAARRQLNQADLGALSAQWQRAGAAVETLAKSPLIPQTLANADAALSDLRTSLAKIDGQVDSNGRDLQVTLARTQEALQQFDAAALTLQRFVGAQQNLGYNANQALEKLGQAADSIRQLADFLERNPNAILSGRRPPP